MKNCERKRFSCHFVNLESQPRQLQGRQMRKLLLLLSCLILAPTSSAAVVETLEYVDYIAIANPPRSLLSTLNAASPLRENGQVLHGQTDWHVTWNFRWFEGPDGRCRITTVTTALTGRITLPRLVGATSTQRGQFDRYLSALRVHELGHYGFGEEAAAEIDREILSLPEMSSCKTLESAASDLRDRMLNEYQEREIRYDAATAHGRSQGTWLEP